MPAETEKAYLAGLIDGDGSILLFRNRKHYDSRVDLCQASTENLKEIQKIWGGRIQKGSTSNHLIWGKKEDVRYILETIMEYTKFKLDQVGIVLLYLSDVAKGKGRPINKQYGEALLKQMKMLRSEFYACKI